MTTNDNLDHRGARIYGRDTAGEADNRGGRVYGHNDVMDDLGAVVAQIEAGGSQCNRVHK